MGTPEKPPPWLLALVPRLKAVRSGSEAFEVVGVLLERLGVCPRCRGDGWVMVTIREESRGRIENDGDLTTVECPKCRGRGKT